MEDILIVRLISNTVSIMLYFGFVWAPRPPLQCQGVPRRGMRPRSAMQLAGIIFAKSDLRPCVLAGSLDPLVSSPGED